MRHLLRALARQPDPLSDAALLARYAADRDPAAFEVLVWRHGGMVLGVCRRHLRDAHAAEDAFQATFLVLSRKAGTVGGNTLPGWLHRVARRAAVRAAAKAHGRRETPLVAELPARRVVDGELAAVLDAEIDRLPDRLRQVVVLCYLDGESTEAAATRLGIPRGTVLSRLHTARGTLTARLTRRGVTPPVVGLTAILTAEQVAGGVRVVGGGCGPATILANEVLAMSVHKTVLVVAVGLVLAGGAGTGVGVLNAQPPGDRPAAGGQPAPAAGPGQADVARRLSIAIVTVEERLNAVRAAIDQARQASTEQLDPVALRAVLLRLDERILSVVHGLDADERQPKPSRQGPRPTAESLHENAFFYWTTHLPELKPEADAYHAALGAVNDLDRGNTTPEAMAAAKAELTATIERAKVAGAGMKDKAVALAQKDWERVNNLGMQQEQQEAADRDRLVKRLREQRTAIVAQLLNAEAKSADLRRLSQRERALVDVLTAVTRRQLARELGVELTAVGPADDPLGDRLDRLDVQLGELKSFVKDADSSRRLKSLEQKVDDLLRSRR